MRTWNALLLVGLLMASAVAGQDSQPCPQGFVVSGDEIIDLVLKAKTVEEAVTRPDLAAGTQVSAPSSSSASSSLADKAGLVPFLGVAIDRGLIGSNSDALTLDFTPFTLRSIFDSSVLSSQTQYQRPTNRRLRAIGFAATLGGKGEKIDRDGDGTIDEALVAEDLDDIVQWEVRLDVCSLLGLEKCGSTDRRDQENWRMIAEAVAAETDSLRDKARDRFSEFLSTRAPKLNALIAKAENVALAGLGLDDATVATMVINGCVLREDLSRFVLENESELRAIAAQEEQLIASTAKAMDDTLAEIAKKPTFTLAYGGTEREEGFGPDSRKVSLRAGFGAEYHHTFNASWTEIEDPLADQEKLDLAYELSYRFLRDSTRLPEGLLGSFSVAYRSFDNVPDAMHDEVALANVKVEIPLTRGIEIPISVTWANHEDLLTDQDEVRGHVGLKIDLSKLTSPTDVAKALGEASN